jgi:hypothetical protein
LIALLDRLLIDTSEPVAKSRNGADVQRVEPVLV